MNDKKIHEYQKLIRVKAHDGFMVVSFMVTKNHVHDPDILHTPIVLQIHGLLGHFLARGTPRLLPHALLKHGFNSLSINTRMAFAGQMTGRGIFDDTIHDIDAAVNLLGYMGFKNIFIMGYSLGASMAVNWAANRHHPKVRGLILEGIHYSLPKSQRRDFEKWGSNPTYDEIYDRAKKTLGSNPYESVDDETFVVYGSRGEGREPMSSEVFTYKSWWFMGGPEADRAMAYKHIGRVGLPILFIRGENDFLIEEWEPKELAKIVLDSGNPHVRIREIAGAKHDCMENPDMTLGEICDMLTVYSVKPGPDTIEESTMG